MFRKKINLTIAELFNSESPTLC